MPVSVPLLTGTLKHPGLDADESSMGPRWLRAAIVVLLGLLLFPYLGSLARPSAGYDFWLDGVLGDAVLAVPAAVCLVRAVLVRAQRVPFALIGLAAAAFTAGNIVYVSSVQFLDPVPYPSAADVGYLTPYPLLFAAVIVLAWKDLRVVSAGSLLDGLLSALACAVVGSALVLRPVLAVLGGGVLAHVVGAAYPIADLTLACLIAAVVTLKAGRPGWTWTFLGSGVVVFAVADSTYLYRVAADAYTVGTPLDGLWAIGLTLMAVAAVLPHRTGGRHDEGGHVLVLPTVFSFVAVAVLVYGSLTPGRLPRYVVVLTALTLLTTFQRIAVGFSSLRLLGATQRQARTDELTQLPNRRHFDERAQQALSRRPPEGSLALVMVDLDGFKAVNDFLGHHAGDELLRQIGPRLQGELRPGDLLARLGGDEFGILLTDIDRAGALALADRVVAAIAEPYLLEGVIQTASASVGIALCPEHGTDLAVLLQRADVAMFDAKAHQRLVTVYDSGRLGGGAERLNVREALARRELFAQYQPQFDTTGQMYGVEALVRWRHPEQGVIPPARFLPFFEQAGLMLELTLYLLDLAVRDRQRLSRDGADLALSVNLAPSALLDDDVVAAIGSVLGRHGMPASALTLEITESAPITDSARSVRALQELRGLGIELSLDDYGTGWCSLSSLVDLPVDEVKIDRSFVLDLMPGSPQAAVISSTVKLAAALGLRTVAEGIETAEALATLRELGCERFQGYFLGRPMAAEAIAALAGYPANSATPTRTVSPSPGGG